MASDPLGLLGRRIRTRRLELQFSQERLAEEAGLHPTYVSRIEAGKGNLSTTKLLSLARALGTTASDLLSDL